MNDYQVAFAIIMLSAFGIFSGWWIYHKNEAKRKKREHFRDMKRK